MNIALLAYIYDLDTLGHCSENIIMINIIAFDSLDTLGLKLFHAVDSKGSCPIWRMPKLTCVFAGCMWCIIIKCIVHVVHMIRNRAMLIVECMKREIYCHFA